jgi:serine protease Do
LARSVWLGATGFLFFWGVLAGPLRAQETAAVEVAAAMERVVVDAIARAERSVVAIARVKRAQAEGNLSLESRPNPFGGWTTPFVAARPTDPDFIPNEYATGVVVGRHGLILTAYHVLGEESDYYVTTADRRVFLATVKGADSRSDLAVLSVEATDLEPITLGDGTALRKGQFVVALGNPYAIARDGQVSASWGIVANLARKAPLVSDEAHPTGKSTLHHFGTLIQTDAKLNLGTSGGPLLNLRGEMVGLTTALAATAGYEQSAGYAMPVDETFRRVVETLKLGREVEYGFLGIAPANLQPQVILAGVEGALIERVVPGMPGERFGLEPNDIVATVNGRPVHDDDGLVLEVGRLPVESVVHLGVIRGGRKLDLDIALTKLKVRGKKIVTAPSSRWRGMTVDYLSVAFETFARTGLGNVAFDDGVIVAQVEEETPAWRAGLRSGMLLSHVDRAAVANPREFHQAVAGKPGPVQVRFAANDGEPPTEAVVRGS